MISTTQYQQDIMAKTIWGEAEGEGYLGKLAVGAIILNRVDDKRWPDSIAEVCLQPKQFSCWNIDPRLRLIASIDRDDTQFLYSLHAVRDLLVRNEIMVDRIAGCTHFHNDKIDTPKWARGKLPAYKIGAHLFYNNVE